MLSPAVANSRAPSRPERRGVQLACESSHHPSLRRRYGTRGKGKKISVWVMTTACRPDLQIPCSPLGMFQEHRAFTGRERSLLVCIQRVCKEMLVGGCDQGRATERGGMPCAAGQEQRGQAGCLRTACRLRSCSLCSSYG